MYTGLSSPIPCTHQPVEEVRTLKIQSFQQLATAMMHSGHGLQHEANVPTGDVTDDSPDKKGLLGRISRQACHQLQMP